VKVSKRFRELCCRKTPIVRFVNVSCALHGQQQLRDYRFGIRALKAGGIYGGKIEQVQSVAEVEMIERFQVAGYRVMVITPRCQT
jgi:hypothetical protein